ncbi:archease [Patescibacteria group bacterium]|nr:archease [Patescibacteria group bacterium]
MKYEILEHTADLKIKAYGKSLEELFMNAARGLMSVMYEEESSKEGKEVSDVVLETSGPDKEALLVNWLSDILLESDTRNVYCFDFSIHTINEQKISSTMKCIKSVAKEDVKAITYHGLTIKKHNGKLEATILVDV